MTALLQLKGGSAFKSPNPRNCLIRLGAAQRISSASESSTVKQRILSGPMADLWTRTRLSQRMAPPTVKQRILSGPISDTWKQTRLSQGGSTHCQKTDPERTHFGYLDADAPFTEDGSAHL
ncbi:unnamed protein product [Arctogadus glacialis]